MVFKIPRKFIFVIVLLLLISVFPNPIERLRGVFKEEEQPEIIDTSVDPFEKSGMRDTILYYKDENGIITPVMRKIEWTEGRGIAKQALRAMINTPKNYKDMIKIGLYPVIPSSTQIIGMNIRDGLCKVDFSKDFTNVVNKEEEQNLIQSVVYTLTEFPTVEEVQFMIEGKVVNNMPHGVQIGEPLRRENVNYIGKKPALDTILVYNESVNETNTTLIPVTNQIQEEPKGNIVVNLLDNVVNDIKNRASR